MAIKKTDYVNRTFELQELSFSIGVRTTIFFLFFLSLEILAKVLSLFRKHHVPCNIKHCDDGGTKKGLLKKWHDPKDKEPLFGRHTSIRFSSNSDKFFLLTINCIFEGAWFVDCLCVLLNRNLIPYAQEAKEVLRRIRIEAENNARYRKRFETLIAYLRDIEESTAEEVAEFVRETAHRLSARSCGWITIVQSQMRTALERNEYQLLGAMATLELFYQEDLTHEVFYFKGYWSTPNRMSKRVLNILFCLSYDRLGGKISEEDRLHHEPIGVESILLSKLDKPFRRMFTPFLDRESHMYRMGTLWEMLLNHYGNFMNENWSTSTLERIEWALQYGREYISKKKYDLLAKKNRCSNLNLRSIDVRTLLVFSASGMIEFSGFDSCIFRLTAVPESKVKLSGYLPTPTIRDLVELGLAERLYKNTYRMLDFPASSTKHKAVRTGDRLLICKSSVNEKFSATLSTRIA